MCVQGGGTTKRHIVWGVHIPAVASEMLPVFSWVAVSYLKWLQVCIILQNLCWIFYFMLLFDLGVNLSWLQLHSKMCMYNSAQFVVLSMQSKPIPSSLIVPSFCHIHAIPKMARSQERGYLASTCMQESFDEREMIVDTIKFFLLLIFMNKYSACLSYWGPSKQCQLYGTGVHPLTGDYFNTAWFLSEQMRCWPHPHGWRWSL